MKPANLTHNIKPQVRRLIQHLPPLRRNGVILPAPEHPHCQPLLQQPPHPAPLGCALVDILHVPNVWPARAHVVVPPRGVDADVLELRDQQLAREGIQAQPGLDGRLRGAEGERRGGAAAAAAGRAHGARVEPAHKELKGLRVILGQGELVLKGLLEARVEGGFEEVGGGRQEVLV